MSVPKQKPTITDTPKGVKVGLRDIYAYSNGMVHLVSTPADAAARPPGHEGGDSGSHCGSNLNWPEMRPLMRERRAVQATPADYSVTVSVPVMPACECSVPSGAATVHQYV
jgi:hypothetical protein